MLNTSTCHCCRYRWTRTIKQNIYFKSVEKFSGKLQSSSGSSVAITLGVNLNYLGLDARKPVLGGLQTTKAQTSLRFRAVRSAHLLFAY